MTSYTAAPDNLRTALGTILDNLLTGPWWTALIAILGTTLVIVMINRLSR